jgi:hypothetical protein
MRPIQHTPVLAKMRSKIHICSCVTVPCRICTKELDRDPCSVADPDPGSGAFFTPGSGIRVPGWVKSQDPDPG